MKENYPNSEVGFQRDAQRIFITESGYFQFNIDGTDFELTGLQLKTVLFMAGQTQVIANAAGVLSTTNLPSVGLIVFSIADAASNASAWFTSGALAGQILEITTRGKGSTGSVFISTSGVSLVGIMSGDLSSITIYNSTNSHAYLKLKSLQDDEWSVLDFNGANVVEHPST